MSKKQNSTQRTKAKALPKESKKLNTVDMKKVKGGATDFLLVLDGIKGETRAR